MDSTSSLWYFHGSNVDPRSNSSAHYSTSNPLGSPAGGLSFSEKQSSPSGFTFPIQNQGNAFQQSINSPFSPCSNPGIGIRLTSSSWPTSSSVGSILSEPKNTSGFRLTTISSASSNNSIFGFQNSSVRPTTIESNASKQCQGSRAASYSVTTEVYRATNNNSVGKIQSISAMPIYKDKSHEELRWEDYHKDGQKLQGGQFSSFFKASDTPTNIFHSSPFSNQSFLNSPFQPFKSNLFAPKTENFITPNNTISASPTLSPSVNPFSFTNSSSNNTISPTLSPSVNPFSFTNSSPNNTISAAPTISPSVNPFSFTNPSSNNTISTAPTISPSVNPFSFTNPSSNNTISPAPTISPSVNPFSFTNSSSNNTISASPTISPSVNPFSFTNPSSNNTISTAPTISPSVNPFSFTNSSSNNTISTAPTLSLSVMNSFSPTNLYPSQSQATIPQPTSVTTLYAWPFIPRASQLGQNAEKLDSVSANDQNQPSQASNGLTTVTEPRSQNINGQQYFVNPFARESPDDQSNAATSRQHGISSLPITNNLSSNRRTPLLRIRHLSLRHPSWPAQRPSCGSCETKVPFFIDAVDKPGPIAPFLPRENPRAWVKNSLFLPSYSKGKGHEHNESSTALTDDPPIQEEDLSATLNQHQEYVVAVTEKHEADVLAIMPKLPEEEYYMKPSIKELAVKEMAEPGWCSHVKDFVVGRRGYGSIKFLGETDVCSLDLEDIVQFNDREVIVYPDDRKKPPVGQSLNKPAEVTLLNVKCISKKTGKQYVEGPQVHSYKEMLIKKTSEQGTEFVSYDPFQGEWKFRVQHF